MRQRSNVFNHSDLDTRRLQARDRTLPARSGTFYTNLEFAYAKLRCPLGTGLGSSLSREWCTLAAAFESYRSRSCPT